VLKFTVNRIFTLLSFLLITDFHLNQVLIDGLNERIERELMFPPENGIPHDKLMEAYRAYEAIKNGRKATEAGLETRV
jgi:hypothetical protein